MTIKSESSDLEHFVVNSSTAKILTGYLAQKGLAQTDIEKTLKYQFKFLDPLEIHLPLMVHQALWDVAIAFTKNPNLALTLAKNPYNNEMSLVSHVFFNSPNLREGLKHYIRYYALINESVTVELTTQKGLANVSYSCINKAAYCPQDIEHTLALSVTRIKEHVGKNIRLKAVHFEHPCHDLACFETFFGCPVYFNQAQSSLIFDEKYLDYTFPNKSSQLSAFLTTHLEQLLSKLKKTAAFSDQVKKMIEASLSNNTFDAEHIASALHMSRPTLYRKLKAEDLCFHEIVDNIRQEKAKTLLTKHQHSLSEIAFLLGFSELSSFSRAFKKWTGSSPAKYSKKG